MWYIGRYIIRPIGIPDLDMEIAKAFQGIPQQFQSCDYSVIKYGRFLLTDSTREKCLLKAAFHLLDRLVWIGSTSETCVKECKVVFEWLISAASKLVEDKNQTKLAKHSLQSLLQTTALAKYQGIGGEIQVTPHRLFPFCDREDPLELFSLLIRDCGLRPSEIALHSMALAMSVKKRFPDDSSYLSSRNFYSVLSFWGCGVV